MWDCLEVFRADLFSSCLVVVFQNSGFFAGLLGRGLISWWDRIFLPSCVEFEAIDIGFLLHYLSILVLELIQALSEILVYLSTCHAHKKSFLFS